MKKVKAFFSISYSTRKLLIESYFFLGAARVAKLLPFSKVAPLLGIHLEETPFDEHPHEKEVLVSVSQAIHIMSRYTIWESQCLVKAIAAMKMLERRKIESTLYLATGKSESGEFVAHAWLRSGPYFITGEEGMEHYTVVANFAKKFN